MQILTIPGEDTGMQLLEALINALLGYGVVFLGLVLLMVVVIIVGKAFSAAAAKKAAAPAPAEEVPAAPQADAPKAPGAAGDVKLNNVDPKTAAMLMAIVADKMQKPINELRFISIKEVE